MAASLEGGSRFSLRYSVGYNRDTLSRTISGLNLGNNSDENPGPRRDVAINALLTVLDGLTYGTINNIRWIDERSVVWGADS